MVQEAPFLGFVQIIVYTGAIMMLFLFVLMLVGRDASDSRRRDAARAADRGDRARHRLRRRWSAPASPRALDDVAAGRAGRRRREPDGNVPALAELLFTDYLFAFELTRRC